MVNRSPSVSLTTAKAGVQAARAVNAPPNWWIPACVGRTTSRGSAGPRITRPGQLAMVLALTLLSACASPYIQRGPQSVDGLQLDTPIEWTDLGTPRRRVWTRDGVLLNTLRIHTDIRPGEPVLRRQSGVRREEGVRFRAGMDAIAIQDLILDALRAEGLADVAASGLRPARLMGRPALRAEIRFSTPEGLRYRGLLLAEGEDGTLSYLLWYAPETYYYGRDREAVEAIFASLGG